MVPEEEEEEHEWGTCVLSSAAIYTIYYLYKYKVSIILTRRGETTFNGSGRTSTREPREQLLVAYLPL